MSLSTQKNAINTLTRRRSKNLVIVNVIPEISTSVRNPTLNIPNRGSKDTLRGVLIASTTVLRTGTARTPTPTGVQHRLGDQSCVLGDQRRAMEEIGSI